MPEQLEFYFGGENENFFQQLLSLSPTPASANFLDFISSDFGKEILRQNRLSIHIETRNLYYDNMNTGKSIYEFIANQQDEIKKIINANLYYGNSFENYLKVYLAGINARFEIPIPMHILTPLQTRT